MKALHVGGIIVTLIVISVGVLYWQNLAEDLPLTQPSELMQTINQCDLIASKAAAELPEALPFQKLEKMARQSRVLDRCMQDRGYQQNPAWMTQANEQASKAAQANNISQDEAYETMRRQAMLQGDDAGGLTYWVNKQ